MEKAKEGNPKFFYLFSLENRPLPVVQSSDYTLKMPDFAMQSREQILLKKLGLPIKYEKKDIILYGLNYY